MRVRAPGLATATAVAVALSAGRASAAEDDGVYGRLDGDLELALGTGVAVADGGPALAVRGSLVYLWAAGIYGLYTDALGTDAASVERSIATGVHFRPLFLGRFGSNAEQGPAHLDLTLDSIYLELGVVWDHRRREDPDGRPGLELGAGLAFPLLPDANGPFVGVRGALRYRDSDLTGHATDDLIEQGALLTITLSWRQVVTTHLVDAGDVAPR